MRKIFNPIFLKLLIYLLPIGIVRLLTASGNVESVQIHHFEGNFDSLNKANPAPDWFKDAKFGIYFHWGVYSVPEFGNEWYPRNMYIEGSTENNHHITKYGGVEQWPYHYFICGAKDKEGRFWKFEPKLKSEGGEFDPEAWAQLFADSGARFAGPVAEHHDGFSMWPSEVNPWNAKDMGPKLDLVGLISDAIREKGMKVILSMHHAYNITGFYEAAPLTEDLELQKLLGQLGKENNEELWLAKHREVIDRYQPDIIWQDFNLHLISQPVLLEFLSYYYNQAQKWGKDVVATYKDGLNSQCAVLDFERGGPVDILDHYWLTDDAISSSSWCYTDGIGYYSKKQVLHGLIDRISKNGNLLLNISPKADGSIPEAQKDILLTMGAWLKKHGEAVYGTRAWEVFGEGPTKMGAAHGVMGEPDEGTVEDVRFTRSKDATELFAILLGWEEEQDKVVLNTLSSNRINLDSLKTIELINGTGEYVPLEYSQTEAGLLIQLPDRYFEELAYVLKLSFGGKIPSLDRYTEISRGNFYHFVPEGSEKEWVLGSDLKLNEQSKSFSGHWKFESLGKGCYTIKNRANPELVLACGASDERLLLSEFAAKPAQFWKIDDHRNGWLIIRSLEHPDLVLSVSHPVDFGVSASLVRIGEDQCPLRWKLKEVCELAQEPYVPHSIPGVIEAEDFDKGCPEEAFHDSDEINEGKAYRLDAVDIEVCSSGGYNVGWTHPGEWMEYSVNVEETGNYKVCFHVASAYNDGRVHIEMGGRDVSGCVKIPNTTAFQSWSTVEQDVHLDQGEHTLKLVIDGEYTNIDKLVFEKLP